MSGDDLSEFFVHRVTVEAPEGAGMWGDVRADPVEVWCFVDDARNLVRDGQGQEITTTATITAPLDSRGLWVPDALVHLPDRDATVIAAGVADSHDLDLPDHVEVILS